MSKEEEEEGDVVETWKEEDVDALVELWKNVDKDYSSSCTAWVLGKGVDKVFVWETPYGVKYCWNNLNKVLELGTIGPTAEEYAVYCLQYDKEDVF